MLEGGDAGAETGESGITGKEVTVMALDGASLRC
jgi:hypothetical protein